jgi:hypothetical protein
MLLVPDGVREQYGTQQGNYFYDVWFTLRRAESGKAWEESRARVPGWGVRLHASVAHALRSRKTSLNHGFTMV